jgi:Ala-tRNA(Pro) deacylase
MHGISYDIVPHPRTTSSMKTAEASHIPGDQIAKSVVVGDGEHYTVVVVPATHRVELGTVHHHMPNHVGLATEEELARLFFDCEPGAIPPIGAAYGIDTVLDDVLLDQRDIYFEAGDHEELIHIHGSEFVGLLQNVQTYRCSHHV